MPEMLEAWMFDRQGAGYAGDAGRLSDRVLEMVEMVERVTDCRSFRRCRTFKR